MKISTVGEITGSSYPFEYTADFQMYITFCAHKKVHWLSQQGSHVCVKRYNLRFSPLPKGEDFFFIFAQTKFIFRGGSGQIAIKCPFKNVQKVLCGETETAKLII